MTHKTCTANYAFFPTYIEQDDDKGLLHWLGRQHDLDFGDYAPRGGGVTIAHLRWTPDGDILLEGIETAEERLPAAMPVAEVAQRWNAFCAKVKSADAIEQFRKRRDDLRRLG